MVVNNTGFSTIKIFLESQKASVSLHSARKIWTLNSPVIIPNGAPLKICCSVESASIPLSYYTVNETNNRFAFADSFKLIRDEVKPGNYTIKTLLKSINDSLTAQGANISLTYDAVTSKVSMYFANATLNNQIVSQSNNIYKLLGLTVGSNLPQSYTAPSCVCLCYTSGIYIALNSADNSNIDTGIESQSSNVLLRIPISQPTNTYLQYFNNVGFKTLLNTQVLSSVDISLLDDNRNLVQLTPNVDWTIVLRIDFERTIQETIEDTKINKLRNS